MAITFVQGGKAGIPFTANTGASTAAFAANVAIGDLIACWMYLQNVSAAFNPNITDNVNAGNYTVDWTSYDSVDNSLLALCHIACNAIGKPSISIAGAVNYTGGNLNAAHYAGFTSTPALDSVSLNGGTGTALNGSMTTMQSNELVLNQTWLLTGGGFYTVPPSPWNDTFIGGGGALADPSWRTVASSGAVSSAGTYSVSARYNTALAGFYSTAPGIVTPNPFYYQRKVLYFV